MVSEDGMPGLKSGIRCGRNPLRGTGSLALLVLASGCVSINDVTPRFGPGDPSVPVPLHAALLPSAMDTLLPNGKSLLEERTDELCEASAATRLFERVTPYSEWSDADIVFEIQERRTHHQMNTLVTVFTILPPFWALWLPYTSWQERVYPSVPT